MDWTLDSTYEYINAEYPDSESRIFRKARTRNHKASFMDELWRTVRDGQADEGVLGGEQAAEVSEGGSHRSAGGRAVPKKKRGSSSGAKKEASAPTPASQCLGRPPMHQMKKSTMEPPKLPARYKKAQEEEGECFEEVQPSMDVEREVEPTKPEMS